MSAHPLQGHLPGLVLAVKRLPQFLIIGAHRVNEPKLFAPLTGW